MLDFTPILEAVIALAVTAITVFLIPWLKNKYGVETLNKAKSFVEVAVYAAEKAYGAGNGEKKLAYVEQFLQERKIKIDFRTLMTLIDAEIKKMEQNEQGFEQGYLIEEEIETDEDTEAEPVFESMHPPEADLFMD